MATSDWRQGLDEWPNSVGELYIDPRRTALVIVDMQNYYVRDDGGMVQLLRRRFPARASYLAERMKVVIPNLQQLLAFFREQGLRRVFLTVGAELPDGSDQFDRRYRRDRRRAEQAGLASVLSKGTYQHAIIDELAPRPDELVLNKNSVSAFNSTALDQYLRNMKVETLVMTGCATDACVETTARDAADRGYNVILVEDACAAFGEEAHVATLRAFARMFGKVATTGEVVQFLQEALSKEGATVWP